MNFSPCYPYSANIAKIDETVMKIYCLEIGWFKNQVTSIQSPFQPIPPQSHTHTHTHIHTLPTMLLLNLPSFFLYPTDLQQSLT